MRFIMGLLLGFGIGFAVAILFAPERARTGERRWAPAGKEEGPAPGGNHHAAEGARSVADSLRARLDEAVSEARKASAEAEKEMRTRYQGAVKKNKPEE
jgi:gas vesicle protein